MVDSLSRQASLVGPLQLVREALGHPKSQVIGGFRLPGPHQSNQPADGDDLDRVELPGLVDHLTQWVGGGGVTGVGNALGRITFADDQLAEQVSDVEPDVEILQATLSAEYRTCRIVFEEPHRLAGSLDVAEILQAVGLETPRHRLAGLGIGTSDNDHDLLAVVVSDLEVGGFEQFRECQLQLQQHETANLGRLGLQLDHLTNLPPTDRKSLTILRHRHPCHHPANPRPDVLLSLGTQPGSPNGLHEARIARAAKGQLVLGTQQRVVQAHDLGQGWRGTKPDRQGRSRRTG